MAYTITVAGEILSLTDAQAQELLEIVQKSKALDSTGVRSDPGNEGLEQLQAFAQHSLNKKGVKSNIWAREFLSIYDDAKKIRTGLVEIREDTPTLYESETASTVVRSPVYTPTNTHPSTPVVSSPEFPTTPAIPGECAKSGTEPPPEITLRKLSVDKSRADAALAGSSPGVADASVKGHPPEVVAAFATQGIDVTGRTLTRAPITPQYTPVQTPPKSEKTIAPDPLPTWTPPAYEPLPPPPPMETGSVLEKKKYLTAHMAKEQANKEAYELAKGSAVSYATYRIIGYDAYLPLHKAITDPTMSPPARYNNIITSRERFVRTDHTQLAHPHAVLTMSPQTKAFVGGTFDVLSDFVIPARFKQKYSLYSTELTAIRKLWQNEKLTNDEFAACDDRLLGAMERLSTPGNIKLLNPDISPQFKL